MLQISYPAAVALITLIWIPVRLLRCRKTGFQLRRELSLLLVYICIVVVARFTFFPFSRVDGQIQPLVFDAERVFPPRINPVPIVHLLDYPQLREAMLNLVGNTAMFLPLGIVWPALFPGLNTHGKVLAAGAGFSLLIELMQLPFFDRVTDIDDLILNTLGYLLGYGIFLLAARLRKRTRSE